MRCPGCSGKGRKTILFIFKKICEICGGTGIIDMNPTDTKKKK